MKDLISVEAKHRRYKSTISDVDKAEKEAVDEVYTALTSFSLSFMRTHNYWPFQSDFL
jgi:hypothetical protein